MQRRIIMRCIKMNKIVFSDVDGGLFLDIERKDIDDRGIVR